MSKTFWIPDHDGNSVKGDFRLTAIYSECPIKVLKVYKPTKFRKFLKRMGFKNIRMDGMKVIEVKY